MLYPYNGLYGFVCLGFFEVGFYTDMERCPQSSVELKQQVLDFNVVLTTFM